MDPIRKIALVTGAFRPKPAAAEWALERLPNTYQPVIERAKAICIGQKDESWEDLETLIRPCADFILKQIQQLSTSPDHRMSNKTISLAE